MPLDDSLLVSGENHSSTPITPRIPLPTMSEENIEAYFYSLQFWFQASNVTTDAAKANIVLASIPPRKLMELRTVIDAAPAANKYHYIRVKLIEHFTESQQRRLQRVLKDLPLGDRRPSELFNEMKLTAGAALNDDILHDLWLNRLPPYAQAAIIATKVPIADKLKIADSIVDSIGTAAGQLNEVATTQVPQDDISNLKSEIAALTQRLDRALSSNRRDRSRSRSRNRRSTGESKLCWYHAKFGKDAKTCRQPCSFGKSTDSQ